MKKRIGFLGRMYVIFCRYMAEIGRQRLENAPGTTTTSAWSDF